MPLVQWNMNLIRTALVSRNGGSSVKNDVVNIMVPDLNERSRQHIASDEETGNRISKEQIHVAQIYRNSTGEARLG
jgi:hypothetical protein